MISFSGLLDQMQKSKEAPAFCGSEYSVFEISASILALQLKHRMSDASVDGWCELLSKISPKPSLIPRNHRQCVVNIGVDLPSGYAPYSHHFCVNDCGPEFVFLPDQADWKLHRFDECPVCGERRFDDTMSSSNQVLLAPRKEMLVYDVGNQLKRLVESDTEFCTLIKSGNEAFVAETMSAIDAGPADETAEIWSRGGSKNAVASFEHNPLLFIDPSTIRLQLGEDGVQPFSMEISALGMYSMGILCYQIISLPGYARCKDKWLLFAAVIPGPSEARNMQGYMKVLTDSLNSLYTGIDANWVDGSSHHLHAVLTGVTADHPAMAKVMGLKGASAARACWKCPCSGKKVGRGGMHFCGYTEIGGYMDQCLGAEYSPEELNAEADQVAMGHVRAGCVKEKSTLQLELHYFCLKDHVEIEPVHTIYECCAKRFWKFVLGGYVVKHKATPNKQFLLSVLRDHDIHENSSLTKATLLARVVELVTDGRYVPPPEINLSEADIPDYVCSKDQILGMRRNAEALVISQDRSRAPKDVTAHYLSMLASDWQHFVLEYSPCIVKETSLHPRAFRAWSYFCSGVRLLMDLPQCLKKAKLAEGLFLEYLTIGESLFGEAFCCISEHNLVHLARQTVTAGPAFCTSGWWLERQMKVAKRSVRNRSMVHVERTMFVRCRIDGALKGFKGLSQDKQSIRSAEGADAGVWFRDNKRVALQLQKPTSSATLLDLLDSSAKASNFMAAVQDLFPKRLFRYMPTVAYVNRTVTLCGHFYSSLLLGTTHIRTLSYTRSKRRVDCGMFFMLNGKGCFGDAMLFVGGFMLSNADRTRKKGGRASKVFIRLVQVLMYQIIGTVCGGYVIDMDCAPNVVLISCSAIRAKALFAPSVNPDKSVNRSYTTAVILDKVARAIEGRCHVIDKAQSSSPNDAGDAAAVGAAEEGKTQVPAHAPNNTHAARNTAHTQHINFTHVLLS